MSDKKVKICGITNLSDAIAACEAGADALGFVFYKKSPRYIEPFKAKEIASKLPPFVKKVGLFVNETPEFINKTIKLSHMDTAQLHFDIKEEFLQELDCDFLEVARVRSRDDIKNIKKERYILVDAFVESYGGEGKRIDPKWFENVDCSKMILAGGLNENNIKTVLDLGFYGFDVSSGVEKTKGIKDHEKIKNFIKTAKNI